MTDRERRLLDAAKAILEAVNYDAHAQGRYYLSPKTKRAVMALEASLQEYFGSERQDT